MDLNETDYDDWLDSYGSGQWPMTGSRKPCNVE
jgi:hypothetical protein